MKKTLNTGDKATMDVFAVLRDAGVKLATNMTGAIYPVNRPVNSEKEDVVINTLVLNAIQAQEGIINVNVHVPNLILTSDNTQPNRTRLNAIGNACVDALDYFHGSGFNLRVENPGLIMQDKDKWFMNIRVRYESIRLDKI